MAKISIYVKSTSNYRPGLPLTGFERLGPEWSGPQVVIGFGEDGRESLTVVGWSDLFGGTAVPVHVARVAPAAGATGYLVWGGNAGVRILDDQVDPLPGAEHLPPGYGAPLVWVEHAEDLPAEVLAVVQEVGL